MIKRHYFVSVTKEKLDKADNNYLKHLYRRAALEFAEDLAKHIEPKELIEHKDQNVVTLYFELTGGSLPDHESASKRK